jgi:hypothetical protein
MLITPTIDKLNALRSLSTRVRHEQARFRLPASPSSAR